jgi:FkbM family methyltransferase
VHRAGLSVTRVVPGTAIVSRAERYDVAPLGRGGSYLLRRSAGGAARLLRLRPGVAVVADGKGRDRIRQRPLGKDAWIVGLIDHPAEGVEIAGAGHRGWVVARRDPSPDAEPELELAVTRMLGRRHVGWLLNQLRVDCVLDVGANIGQYGRALRRHGYEGHIVSFEPVPEFAEATRQAAADDPRWSVHQVALGTFEGTAPIRVQRSFSSLLDSSEYGIERFETLREGAEGTQVEVPLRRLDGMLDEILATVIAEGVQQPRVYLKMDTQGFDLEVFRGLGDRMDEIVAMQSEVALRLIYQGMPRMPEALAVYEAAGFEITGLYPITREPDGRVIEYDVTLIRTTEAPARDVETAQP